MNNSKGFTFIELLGVIVILIIISLISLYVFKNIRGKIEEKNYNQLISYIETSAEKFAEDNGIEGVITLQDLIDTGYVTLDDKNGIYNPINRNSLNCNIINLTYSSDEDKYVSEFTDSIKEKDAYNKCNADYVQIHSIGSFMSSNNIGYSGNVILVLDISGSMDDEAESGVTRMTLTKEAINSLGKALLSNNGILKPDDAVELALITFSEHASIALEPTTSYSEFQKVINGLTAFGGTNWEEALQLVADVNFKDSDPTNVIFISDGAPTFRVTKGRHNDWHAQQNAFGTGLEEEPNMQWCYEEAIDDAKNVAEIVGKDNFYTIFTYGTDVGANYLNNLAKEAKAPDNNYYHASNAIMLKQAFETIIVSEKILNSEGKMYLNQDGTIMLRIKEISVNNPLEVYNENILLKRFTGVDNLYLKTINSNYYFDITKFAKDKNVSIKSISIKYNGV